MNRENLRKLSEYLKGPLKAGFCMRAFSSYDDDDIEVNCGTVGCAAGHGPHAGFEKMWNETWTSYIERVFGLHFDTKAWRWCFAPYWVKGDDTALGAAQRIDWMLDNGVPDNYWGQMRGEAKLCYKGEG